MSQSNPFNTLKPLKEGHFYYSLEALGDHLNQKLDHLPLSIRILLEAALRHVDGNLVTEQDIHTLAEWKGDGGSKGVPFCIGRVILQDFTGVPLLVDLAAMQDAAIAEGKDPSLIEPAIPVDLVVDHSVQVDRSGTRGSFDFNLNLEFGRNKERYLFLKWGEKSFGKFRVVPPGIGIVHQVNLEHLAQVVCSKQIETGELHYFDTLVGTDSHTTMINGLGILGWGVGGIEAQSALLGLPLTLEWPRIIGVHLKGQLAKGTFATDLALYITEMLRRVGVVNHLVEFFGQGVEGLSVAARSTIANMAPEYGATCALFPIDEMTLDYLASTGRSQEKIDLVETYAKRQGLFGVPKKDQIVYSKTIEIDLSTIEPCVSGPKRPQDRITLHDLANKFKNLLRESGPRGYGKEVDASVHLFSQGDFSNEVTHPSGGVKKLEPGAEWSEAEMVTNRPFNEVHTHPGYLKAHPGDVQLKHGSIVLAAITSCTNTSNPEVLIAAGLLAKKAVQKGLKVNSIVKTSLAPGSRVVTDYLKKAALEPYLDALGFNLVGYGCTTCIGNSGPLDEKIEKIIREHDLIVASVLSGNRNFEARIHSSVKANFLMSPPLVIAFALAGRIDIDLTREPVGYNEKGVGVFLKEIWPTDEEINAIIASSILPEMFEQRYAHIHQDSPLWSALPVEKTPSYRWNKSSTYIQKPPYFDRFTREVERRHALKKMRCLAIFGDSVTTDHISPAGSFHTTSDAGKYLLSLGVKKEDFNSYGSRRGNHHVMKRGTFANVRLKNKMVDVEGGFTKLMPDGENMTIFEACQIYEKRGTPLIVFAGADYGMGSSRDWAAKGVALLGVKAVVAKSFERIHKSNLVGMGVLPLELMEDTALDSLQLVGDELFSINMKECTPKQKVSLEISRSNGRTDQIELILRIDTPLEAKYYLHGGIMPYVLRQLL